MIIDVDKESLNDKDFKENKGKVIVNSLEETNVKNKDDRILIYRDNFDGKKRIDKELYSDKGLRNLGNTWFFNSTMQWLTAWRDMYFAYTDTEIGHSGKGYEFNDTLRDFLKEMRDSNRDVIDPVDLFRAITK